MFDLSLSEILLVLVVIVLFIRPEDLPVVVRAFAKCIAYIRGLAHEFKAAFDDLAKESGLSDIGEQVKREVREIEKSTVIGDDGEEYEAYDLSDFLPDDNMVKKTTP